MVKGRRLLSWAGILLFSGAASLYGIRAQSEKEPPPAPETAAPDLVRINALAAYQKLELPRPSSPMTSTPRRLARRRRSAPPATSYPSPTGTK